VPASLPTFTMLKASVTPAISLTEIPERYISRIASSTSRSLPLVALNDLSDELALADSENLKALNLACRGSGGCAGVVTVALSSPGRGQLPVAGLKALSHLLFEDLLMDGHHPGWRPKQIVRPGRTLLPVYATWSTT